MLAKFGGNRRGELITLVLLQHALQLRVVDALLPLATLVAVYGLVALHRSLACLVHHVLRVLLALLEHLGALDGFQLAHSAALVDVEPALRFAGQSVLLYADLLGTIGRRAHQLGLKRTRAIVVLVDAAHRQLVAQRFGAVVCIRGRRCRRRALRRSGTLARRLLILLDVLDGRQLRGRLARQLLVDIDVAFRRLAHTPFGSALALTALCRRLRCLLNADALLLRLRLRLRLLGASCACAGLL